ncbi:MarR family winged helix-turn-helix transcriptional regulator [Micromonospora chersina]|uniref:MarR family winged helix-turn-helix transcriptional regulator n=1 Tax=Micromonospora chersina TaxID=47854 RepID=UPI003719BD89
MTQPRWLNPEEQRLWLAFLRMRRAIDAAIDGQLAEAGLSPADYDVLAPLSQSGEALRVRDLAALIGWDRSRIAHQLRRMEQRGLVARSGSTTDRRGTLVHLTDLGRTAITTAAPGHVETVRRVLFDQLDQHDLTGLTDIAERVADAAGLSGISRTGGPAPRGAAQAGRKGRKP